MGISAPAFCWLAGALIIVFTAECYRRLRAAVVKQCGVHSVARQKIKSISETVASDRPGEGLAGSTYEELRKVFEESGALRAAWHNFRKLVLVEPNRAGEDRLFVSEPAEAAFAESAIITPEIDLDFYRSVPGFITGVGLLVTFLAILFALLGVHYDNDRVTGLNSLITGLSGKFLSSVAALGSASLYLLLEKPLLHRLEISRLRLIDAIDSLMPRRTAAAVLVELHRDLSEQSTAFRSFNTDLSLKLKQSFSESVGPLQQRMVDVIEELNQQLRAADAQKQDSIAANLTGVLENLERSIGTTLNQMGDRFSEALSGSTKGEFSELARSLTGASTLLEQMAAQSRATQDALTEVVGLARATTSDQLALGKSQIEELSGVLNRLMAQMTETTGSSVAGIAAALTSAVGDMSQKVAELSERMSTSMAATADRTTGAAHAVVEQAGEWTAKSTEQLNQLMERHHVLIGRVEDISGVMDGTLVQLKESIPQLTVIAKELRAVSNEVSSAASSAVQTTIAMKNAQDSVSRTAGHAQAQAEALSKATGQVLESMEQYQKIFERIRTESGQLLNQIGQNLSAYTDVSRKGFEEILKSANEQMGTAVQRLGASIEELDEYLQELTDVLGKSRPAA